MSKTMTDCSKQVADAAEALSPYEDTSREYRAMRGKRTGGQRVFFILFAPNEGTHDRYLPLSDLRLMDTAKSGREIMMEFSAMTVKVTGRNLNPVAGGISAGWVAALEVFNHELRDMPADGVPHIEKIQFYRTALGEALPLFQDRQQLLKPK